MREVRPDYLQLHGQETPERVAEISRIVTCPIIKAVPVADDNDVSQAGRYGAVADLLLFDAKPRPDDALPGGNGVPFDWHALMGREGEAGFILSGGLDADNVSEAIRVTGAKMVDVSSGVERVRGEKDPDLVALFIERAKSASERSENH